MFLMEDAMRLHQRGVDLLVDVMDAADHLEELTQDETRRLLKEVAEVMSLILERDAKIALKKERIYFRREIRRTASTWTFQSSAEGTSRVVPGKVR